MSDKYTINYYRGKESNFFSGNKKECEREKEKQIGLGFVVKWVDKGEVKTK